MAEGSGPTTRFSATELEDGCWKTTDSLAPMLKLCQLSAARLVVWLMSVCAPD
jgi:hypothetical protein